MKTVTIKDETYYTLSKIKLFRRLGSYDDTINFIMKNCDSKLYKENKPNEITVKKSDQPKTRV